MTVQTEQGYDQTVCPSCGQELTAEAQADGSYAAATCSKCYKPASKSDVKADVKEAEQAQAGVVTEKGV